MGLLRSLEEGGVLLVVHPRPLVQVRDRHAGVHGVHADTLRRELEGGAPRQVIEARLAHVVGQDTGKRPQAVHARHVDHRPLARHQMGRRRTHQPERCAQVQRHHPIPRRIVGRLDRPGRDDPRGVDDDVDAAERVERGSNNAIGRLGRGEIDGARNGPSAGGGHGGRGCAERGGVAGHQHHARLGTTERLGRRPADAARRASNHDALLCE